MNLRLQVIIDEILAEYPGEVADYRDGIEDFLGWLMGRIKSETQITLIRNDHRDY